MLPLIGPLVEVAGKVLDKVIPDPAQREQAKLELLKAQQAGELDTLNAQLSAILAEAQSSDPWTSRARPTFLYVCYALLLAGIPMGVLAAVAPQTAAQVATGFKAWLHAIPDSIVTLMEVGYLGYTGARAIDKWKGRT
jgi:hypothetical protein